MREIRLRERLEAVARYVTPPGGTVADIGTDHGHVPVRRIQSGVAERVIASDIRSGPLEAAKRTAETFGVSDRIEFVLAPGLDGVPERGADTVIIAGLGAETIIKILTGALWTRDVRLILQPQTKPELLLSWLRNNGYTVSDVSLSKDAGRLYVIMLAGGEGDAEDSGLVRILFEKRDPLLAEYIDQIIKKLKKKLEGQLKGEEAHADGR